MSMVQYKADYTEGESVSVGTIVLHNAQLFFATQATNSSPDNKSVWAKIGEVGKPSGPSFLDGLFGATPKDKTPEEVFQQQPRNLSNPTKLSFDDKQAGGRRRRRTVKKPRRK
jgi:hypothetical protein